MTIKNGLHYRVTGDGPPLLLLHGFTGAGAWWDPYVERFAKNYTTVILDLPGHGHSKTGPDPYRFDQVATDMFGLMDELGVGPFRAVGHSGGGIVLTHMAIQEPSRIESMVIVSAPHVHDRMTMLGFPRFEDHPARVREYWLGVHPGGEVQVRRLVESFHHLAEHVEEIDVPPEKLSSIQARTLIVLGDRDPLFPVHLATEMYQAIPSAALWIVPSQGHSAIWPDWDGSAEAASIFSAVATKFMGTEPLEGLSVQ